MTVQLPGTLDEEDDTPEEDVATKRPAALKVPGNVLAWVTQAARQFGVPRDLLAAVIHQHDSSYAGLNPTIVSQIAAAITRVKGQGLPQVSDYPGEVQGEQDVWLDAATMYSLGTLDTALADAYRSQLSEVYGTSKQVLNKKSGRYETLQPLGVTLGTDVKLPEGKYTTARFPGGIGGSVAYGPGGGGAARQPIIPGLTDDEATAVQRVADSIYIQYMGRFPTTKEYNDISRSGYTPQTLEEHLRSQAIGGTTVGQYQDIKATANKYAQQQFGRDADPGEINFLIEQKLTGSDQVSAYYEQLRTRRDTGDPAFAWASDPATWKDTQSTIESLWRRAGLTGKVDPHLVNQAIQGNWSQDDITRHIDNLPAPGFAQGVTVGQVNRIRQVAQPYKDAIGSVVQGEPLTSDEIKTFLGMPPLGIREYYRSLPWGGRGKAAAPGGTAGAAAQTAQTGTTAGGAQDGAASGELRSRFATSYQGTARTGDPTVTGVLNKPLQVPDVGPGAYGAATRVPGGIEYSRGGAPGRIESGQAKKGPKETDIVKGVPVDIY